jgi:hypothetical protein
MHEPVLFIIQNVMITDLTMKHENLQNISHRETLLHSDDSRGTEMPVRMPSHLQRERKEKQQKTACSPLVFGFRAGGWGRHILLFLAKFDS